jgi:hypothetical protein
MRPIRGSTLLYHRYCSSCVYKVIFVAWRCRKLQLMLIRTSNLRVVVAGVHEFRSLAPAHIPCLLLARLRSLYIFAKPGKFDSPSEDDLTVSFHRCRRRNASGTVHSTDLRVTHCMVLESSADYFVYWS